MKKIIRTLTIAVIALVSVFACAFAAACGGNDDNAISDYNFTIVYEDGTAVNGQTGGANGGKVATQICLPNGGCVSLDLPIISIFPDENGKLGLSQTKINELFAEINGVNSYKDEAGNVTKFAFHVMKVPGYKDDCGVAVNGKGDYKVTLTKN